jgi:hypothetical protein
MYTLTADAGSNGVKDLLLSLSLKTQPTAARGSGVFVLAPEISSRPLFLTVGHVVRDGAMNLPRPDGFVGGPVYVDHPPFLVYLGKQSLDENGKPDGNPSALFSENLKVSADLNLLLLGRTKETDFDEGSVSPRTDFAVLAPDITSPAAAPDAIAEIGDFRPNETALVLGFPGRSQQIRDMYLAQGPILSDKQAAAAVKANFFASGPNSYDPASELLVKTHCAPGMSGGPAFNSRGEVIGLIESAPENRQPYVRVVRADYILKKLREGLALLSEAEREKLAKQLGIRK